MSLHDPRAWTDVAIRQWSPDDAEELAEAFAADREALENDAPWRAPAWFSADGQRARIQRCLDDPGVLGFVITRADAIAGTVSLNQIRRDILQSADLGYWVGPRHRRRGVATRAIGLATDHAFSTMALHRIHATVALDNPAWWRALEANGFERVGIIREFALIGGRWRDHHLYQRTAPVRDHPTVRLASGAAGQPPAKLIRRR